ncbi:MAG: glycosyltransferase family 4 protein, partial [Rhodospirillaceae bacterium]
MVDRIALVLKGWPRLSETFIAQEILGLEQAGIPITIISLRHPTDKRTHPIHDEIAAPVTYLPEYLHQEPLRVLRGWRAARHLPGYREALAWWWRDLKRDLTLNRIRRFGQSLVLAAELPPGTSLFYSHFLHTPTSVARYAAMMRGLPLTISAHAKDIWTIPDWEKAEKLAFCRWLTTCTGTGAAHLASLLPTPEEGAEKVKLVYHGLDLERFPARPVEPTSPESLGDSLGQSLADGSDPDRPVQLISVGRAVPKKGYPTLLEALARLPQDLHWRFTHIGGGKESKALKAQADKLGLADRISWLGARPQQEVLAAYGASDAFVLPCRVEADGDRDGLPNVLMEAQSQRLACVSTKISAIPELIEDGVSGLLVPPDD